MLATIIYGQQGLSISPRQKINMYVCKWIAKDQRWLLYHGWLQKTLVMSTKCHWWQSKFTNVRFKVTCELQLSHIFLLVTVSKAINSSHIARHWPLALPTSDVARENHQSATIMFATCRCQPTASINPNSQHVSLFFTIYKEQKISDNNFIGLGVEITVTEYVISTHTTIPILFVLQLVNMTAYLCFSNPSLHC